MSLTEQLDDLKKQLGQEIPHKVLEEIGQFLQKLAKSGIANTSCQAGDKAPSFTLPNVSGQIVSSENLLARGPLVLSFYRGIW